MSIQSEITRIKNARDDAFTQVATKGVTVPAGVNIEDLPGLIQAIQQGGGIELPNPITAGDTPALLLVGSGSVYGTTMQATGVKITVPYAGTYRFKTDPVRFTTSGTFRGQFYKNGSAISETLGSFESGKYHMPMSFDIACAAGDTIEVYLSSRSTSYGVAVFWLAACIHWDNGFYGG